MHVQKRTRIRTQSVTAKVTLAEEAALKTRAEQEGLTLGEWARKSLLAAAEISPDTTLILSEVMALRIAVLAIQSEGLVALDAITKERVTQLVDAAEKSKFSSAAKRVQAFRTQASADASPNESGAAA